MSAAPPSSPPATLAANAAGPAPPAPPDRTHPRFLQAPLAPVALAATIGLIADRYFSIPLAASLLTLVLGLAAWFFARRSANPLLPLLYLGGSIAGFTAA